MVYPKPISTKSAKAETSSQSGALGFILSRLRWYTGKLSRAIGLFYVPSRETEAMGRDDDGSTDRDGW